MWDLKFLIWVFTIVFSTVGSQELKAELPEDHVSHPYLTAPKKRLIVDTDAGGDDGVALLNLLAAEGLNAGIKVELITAVSGNTHVDNVGRNVLKVLKTINRLDIPLYKGANESLLGTPKRDNFFGQDGFGDFDFKDPPSESLIKKEHAVNALIKATTANPGQLTLVCLGPLTNIALAIRMDKNFLKNLKSIYIMGGSVNGVGNVKPGAEFNFYIDPEAVQIVFQEAQKYKKILHLVPWETPSVRNVIEMKWRTQVLGVINSPQVKLINKAERLTLHGDAWISCDTFLSAVVLDESIIESVHTYHVDIEVCGQHSRSAVFVDYARTKNQTENIHIIQSINVIKFKKMLLQNFNAKKSQIKKPLIM